MGNKPDWVGTNFKKGEIQKLADGSALPDMGYNPEEENFEAPFELRYEASGEGANDFGGGGRIGMSKLLDERGDSKINFGVSGSHWKGGGQSGRSLDAIDATYINKDTSLGVAYEPGTKKVQVTFNKSF